MAGAVDSDDLAADESGGGCAEESDDGGDFGRTTVSFQSAVGDKLCVVKFMIAYESFGDGSSWSNAVDGNVVWS